MKYFFLLIVNVLTIKYSTAQNNKIQSVLSKPAVDTECFERWPTVTGISEISNDGKFVTYQINNIHFKLHNGVNSSIIVQSTKTKWKIEIDNQQISGGGHFTNDSKYFIYKTKSDSLSIIRLGSNEIKYMPNVNSYQIGGGNDKSLLCYWEKKDLNKLILFDLNLDKKISLASVDKYLFSKDSKRLLLQISELNRTKHSKLILYDLVNMSSEIIFDEGLVGNMTIDDSGENLAFFTMSNPTYPQKRLWYYHLGKSHFSYSLDESQLTDTSNIRVNFDSPWSFSVDGTKLYVHLYKKAKEITQNTIDTARNLKIWSYNNVVLPSEQNLEAINGKYIGFVNLNTKKLVKVTKDYENIAAKTNRFIIIEAPNADSSKTSKTWYRYSKRSYVVFDMSNGLRKPLDNRFFDNLLFHEALSPTGDFVIGFDNLSGELISYELATNTYRDISKGQDCKCRTRFVDQDNFCGFPVRKWASDGKTFFASDDHDIWKFDVYGQESPICITKRYGVRNNLSFYFINSEVVVPNNMNEQQVIVAFDNQNKQNGFFQTKLNGSNNPVKLVMDDALYQLNNHTVHSYDYTPKKAKFSNAFLVKKMNAKESPNYFFTKDFKTFNQLSFIYPERQYNWLTSELHSWKSLDNRNLQGILYKPENFDFKKKYPVIIHFYEKVSDALHCYQAPDAGMGDLSIAYFVSNGYLVFYADVVYDKEGSGVDAYQAIQSAYNYLSKMSFVDSTKIGLQGNSQGGIHTNNILTRSSSFAAACTSAGYIDLVAISGRLDGLFSGSSMQRYFADGQTGTNQLLWENKEKYINNSPIFELDKITTPVLMQYGTKDSRLYLDGIEFFTSMRLLGKKTWFLEYTNAGHGPTGSDAVDYTIRMYQFFNYYLKNAPAPLWMVENLPIKDQNIKNGLELDRARRTP
ncbi:alpha/beta hydrolase family protein [Pedobacter sp. PWIIR3]